MKVQDQENKILVYSSSTRNQNLTRAMFLIDYVLRAHTFPSDLDSYTQDEE